MKYLLLLTLLIPTAYAKNCSKTSQTEDVLETTVTSTNVPKHLQGAKIIVRRADGKESEVPAELFKVVPRRQERLITKVATNTVEVCKEEVNLKNRVSLLGGYGTKSGLDKSVTSTKAEFETKTGAVGGLQYQRLLGNGVSVGVQSQSNKTNSLMIGIDF